MLLRLAALLTLLTAAFFLQRAANPIFEQNARVRQWPAVDVTVTVRLLETPVRPPAGHAAGEDSRSGAPMINVQLERRHEIGGLVFRTTRFNPTSEEIAPAGPEFATAGQASYVRRGHYDPKRPGEVFFPKAFGFRDYLPVFIWAPLFALGFGGLFLRKPGRAVVAPVDRAGKGWHRLRPTGSLGYRARAAWGVAVVCNVLLGLAVYDYFTGEPRARSTVSNLLVCLAAAPGLFIAGLAVYYSWMARRVGEPAVSVDAVRLRPGDRLSVKLELPLQRDFEIEQVVVSLTCVRAGLKAAGHGLGWRGRELYAERVERDVARRAGSGTRVSFEQRFRIPPDAEPSSLSRGGFAGPRIDWYIEVHFRLDHGPDYRGRFPVTIEAG